MSTTTNDTTPRHENPNAAEPLGAQADVDVLRAALDGPWRDLRERVRRELPADAITGTPGEPIDVQRERVTRQVLALADMGYGSIGFPTEHGGTLDYGASCVAFEMQAFGDLSLLIKLGVQFGLFGGALARLGTERHLSAYLPDIMSGRLMGCFAMTEIGHGSNVAEVETTATYDIETDEIVIHSPTVSATKTYIGNAAKDGKAAVVFAQLVVPQVGDVPDGEEESGEHGVHALFVRIRDDEGNPMPGVTIGDNGAKGGLPGVDNGTIAFDHVRVPRENLLDKFGGIDETGAYVSEIDNVNRRFFTMLGTLVRGRVCVGGGSGSAAQKALAIAIRYGDQRRQFAAPGGEQEIVVLDYLAHQRKLLPRLAKSYALRFAQNAMTSRLQELEDAAKSAEGGTPGPDHEDAQRELESWVAGMKAQTTWHALDTIQACREACGGAGYMAVNGLTQMRADVDVFATFEGDNTVLMQLVAKGLLTEYRDSWGDLDIAGMIARVASQTVEGLVENTLKRAGLQKLIDGATPRNDETALDSRGWQESMFSERASHLLETAAMRLRKAGKDNGFEVFNNAQDHILAAAKADIDLRVFEAFQDGLEAMEDGSARDLMAKVFDLYALSSIEEDKGWFMEHGRLSVARSKAVTTRINSLCGELRPHAVMLTEAFGIPEGWLENDLIDLGQDRAGVTR